MNNLYFDNASTSWPKPACVSKAVKQCMDTLQGNPGRSQGGSGPGLVALSREAIASFFNIADVKRIIFTPNATGGTNLAIRGLCKPGWRVVTSSMEHNAIARPLFDLKQRGIIELEIVAAKPDGSLDPDSLRAALSKKTQLVAITHASNSFGTLNDIRALGAVAHDNGSLFMVDASQSAGAIPIDVKADNIDILACPGHKSLLGPSGTGICYIGAACAMAEPVMFGGTGSYSELDGMPIELPDRHEAGTLNFHGLAGLRASLAYLAGRGLHDVRASEERLARRMLDGLSQIPKLKLHGTDTAHGRLLVFSLSHESIPSARLGEKLYTDYRISSRSGLHCAPWAHASMGTSRGGTLRLSPGLFHRPKDIDYCIQALDRAVNALSKA